MNSKALTTVIDRTVREQLAPVAVDEVMVEPRRDSNNEEALYVTVELPAGTPILPGEKLVAAMVAVSDALLELGEMRFPYLKTHRVGEPAVIEERGRRS